MYDIVRYTKDKLTGDVTREHFVVGLTLEKAQKRCSSPKTRGENDKVSWFEGYIEQMPRQLSHLSLLAKIMRMERKGW